MGALKAFADTKVSLFQTQGDLEKLLAKEGITASRWTNFAELGKEPGLVRFEFQWRKKAEEPEMGFRIEVGYKYVAGPRGGNNGTTREQAARAIYWHVKNLLDAVAFGLVEMQEAFMPYLLNPASDRTIYQEFAPKIDALLAGGDMPPLLPRGRGEA